jgi:CHAT domain-containing protein
MKRTRISAALPGFLSLVLAGTACRSPQPRNYEAEARAHYRHGRYLQALETAAAGVSAIPESQDPNRYWALQLLRCQYLIANRRAREAESVLARPIPASVTLPSIRLRQRMLSGYLHYRNGRIADAIPIIEEVRWAAIRLDDEALALEAQQMLAPAREDAGDRAGAEHVMLDSLERARRRKDSYEESATLLNLSQLRLQQSRFDECRSLAEQSNRVAREAGFDHIAALALGNLASALYRLGDFEASIAARQQAQPVLERLGNSQWRAESYGELGNTYVVQGKPAEAIPYFEKALALAREMNSPEPIALWTGNLAAALIDSGRTSAAEPLVAEARRLNELKGDRRGLAYVQLHEAGIALAREDFRAAEAAYRAAMAAAPENPSLVSSASAGLARVFRRSGRPQQARQAFEKALAVVESAQAGLQRNESKITFLSQAIRLYQEYVAFLIEQGDEDQALAIADSSRARVLAERSEAQVPVTRIHRSGAIALARAMDATLLSYWIAPEGSSLWIISKKGLRRVPLPGEARIRKLVELHRRLVEDTATDPRETSLQAGRELHRILVEPAANEGTRFVVVPDGPLHALNLETLPAGDQYWITQATVSVAPALSLLAASRPAAGAPPRGALIVGDPVDVEPDFPKLVHAGGEIRALAKMFTEQAGPVRVLQGAQATPAAYAAANPRQYRVIHFAAHGQASAASPLDSVIILSPGPSGHRLYAAQVLEYPLRARLVTISACRGAGARNLSGEGLVGFAWAFLRAGARSVIAGLWDVSDSSTAQLMTDLYGGLQAGFSPAAALREAKLRMVRSPSNFRKPFYWGPFQVYESSVEGRRH